jgi:hypothetical protein
MKQWLQLFSYTVTWLDPYIAFHIRPNISCVIFFYLLSILKNVSSNLWPWCSNEGFCNHGCFVFMATFVCVWLNDTFYSSSKSNFHFCITTWDSSWPFILHHTKFHINIFNYMHNITFVQVTKSHCHKITLWNYKIVTILWRFWILVCTSYI